MRKISLLLSIFILVSALSAVANFNMGTCTAQVQSTTYPPPLAECSQTTAGLADSFITQAPNLAQNICGSPQGKAAFQKCFATATAQENEVIKLCNKIAADLKVSAPLTPDPLASATVTVNEKDIPLVQQNFKDCALQACAFQGAIASGATPAMQGAGQVSSCISGLIAPAQQGGGFPLDPSMLASLLGAAGGAGGGGQQGGGAGGGEQNPYVETAKLTIGTQSCKGTGGVVRTVVAGGKCPFGLTAGVAANLQLSSIPDDEKHLLGLGQRTIGHISENERAIADLSGQSPSTSMIAQSPIRVQELTTGASQDLSKTYSADKIFFTDRININHDGNLYTLEGFNNLGIVNHEGLIELPSGGKTIIHVSNPEGALTTDAEGSIVWHVPGTTEYTGEGYEEAGSYISDSGLIHINTFTGIIPPYPTSTQTAITGAQTAEPSAVTFTAKKRKAPLNGADVTPEGNAIHIRGNGNFEGVLVGENRVFPFHFRGRAKGSTHSAYFLGNQLRKDYIIDDGKQQYKITANPVTVMVNNKVIEAVQPLDRTLTATEKLLLYS